MTVTANDTKFMARAIQLAKKGLYTTHPNPRVGCVIVKKGEIIAEGFTQPAGQDHAEINALSQLQAKNASAEDAIVYVTLEPCSHTGKTPPCANALIKHKVSRVVVAILDPNPLVSGQGIKRLRDAGITVDVGILEDEARSVNAGFIKRMEQGLPWVRVKLAMSLDGKTAMASGESKWITGTEARMDVQYLRAQSSAILTGIGTVLADDPSLNVRLTAQNLNIEVFEGEKSSSNEHKVHQPKRIVLDTDLRMPIDAQMLSLPGQIILCASSAQNKNKKVTIFKDKGVKTLFFDKEKPGRLPLKKVFQQLGKEEINEIHVEAGATLCGALLQEKLVDEIVIYMAPTLMGADARSLVNLPEIASMKDKIDLNILDIRAVGNDWRITLSCN